LLQNSAGGCGGLVVNAKVSALIFGSYLQWRLSCKIWNHGKNLICKHVLGERCLVFEAVVSIAHVAVRSLPKFCGVTQTREVRTQECAELHSSLRVEQAFNSSRLDYCLAIVVSGWLW
jgi:hypothetical protein